MSYYQDNHITVYNKDCRAMSELPDESVQCVVTSPPYWGLRKYSGEQDLVWGGDNHHGYEWGEKFIVHKGHAGTKSTLVGTQTAEITKAANIYGSICSLCGAWRGAFGLEPTPEMYIAHTIEILREIRRVLRKDGVVFFNIGDSYASGKGTCFNPGGGETSLEGHTRLKKQSAYPLNRGNKSTLEASKLKPKDLCLIPFKVAIAAQSDGWWIRSVIIWSKPNPMPESVTDRPTESHEYILMLTKSARYYWDQEAVREEYTEPLNRWGGDTLKRETAKTAVYKDDILHLSPSSALRAGAQIRPNPAGRNIRSVWEFPTQAYPEAHFAVFPEKLPEICIKAASKEGDTILDPFAGAGTTLWAAKKLNRCAVGYELSEEYCDLIIDRNRQQVMI